jgi:SAM-dependent methyltransferase
MSYTPSEAPSENLSDAALLQRRLWSADADGWALFSEPHTTPLFEAVLTAAAVGNGTRLLDIGCGTGLALQLAADRGATVTGVDVSQTMLDVARRRLAFADLRALDMQTLPFEDAAFDVVIGVNAFQFAEDPVEAIAEAARVCAPGGHVVVGMFADPSRAESTAVHLAMTALSPPARESEHAPYALSTSGNLEAAFEAAGLRIESQGEVQCAWTYEKKADAVRGLIGSAGGTRAVEDAGVDAVTAAIEAALVPFTDPATGAIVMHNWFRWVSARQASL